MAFTNVATNEINVKVGFLGTAGSQLLAVLPEHETTELSTLLFPGAKTLEFFSWRPEPHEPVQGRRLVLHIYGSEGVNDNNVLRNLLLGAEASVAAMSARSTRIVEASLLLERIRPGPPLVIQLVDTEHEEAVSLTQFRLALGLPPDVLLVSAPLADTRLIRETVEAVVRLALSRLQPPRP